MPKDSQTFLEFPYFVTLTVVGWTDFFVRNEYRQLLIDNLQYCQQNKGLDIHCYCLMTSHLHMIASGKETNVNEILKGFKSFTAKALMHAMDENPQESRKEWLDSRFRFLANLRGRDTERQFWERDNYPEAILTDNFYRVKEKYIHQNPVEAGFVARAEDWFYSSACPDGPLKLMRLE